MEFFSCAEGNHIFFFHPCLSAERKTKKEKKKNLCPSFYSSGRDTAAEQMSRVIFSILERKFVSQLLTGEQCQGLKSGNGSA